jgi:hypothetical protein
VRKLFLYSILAFHIQMKLVALMSIQLLGLPAKKYDNRALKCSCMLCFVVYTPISTTMATPLRQYGAGTCPRWWCLAALHEATGMRSIRAMHIAPCITLAAWPSKNRRRFGYTFFFAL